MLRKTKASFQLHRFQTYVGPPPSYGMTSTTKSPRNHEMKFPNGYDGLQGKDMIQEGHNSTKSKESSFHNEGPNNTKLEEPSYDGHIPSLDRLDLNENSNGAVDHGSADLDDLREFFGLGSDYVPRKRGGRLWSRRIPNEEKRQPRFPTGKEVW